MKKLLVLLLITPLFLFSQKSQGTTETILITESLESNWTGVAYNKRVEVTSDPTVSNFDVAKKGYKFAELAIRIKNTSKTKINVDLSKFELVDKDSNVYTPNYCQVNNRNKLYCTNFDLNIKPKKKKIAIITFSPQIPKTSIIKTIRYNGVDIFEFKPEDSNKI